MKFIAVLSTLPLSALAAGSFSYDPESDKAPGAWGSLDMPGNQCGGASQSGIDVPLSNCDRFEDYIFAPGSCTLDDLVFTLNDHSIRADYKEGCTPPRMTIPGKPVPYDAVQFHLHTGTDHALGGTYFGSCMHLVHKQVGGDSYSVLGFFLEPTDPDGIPKFRDLLSEWEAVATNTKLACGQTGATGDNLGTGGSAQQGGGRRAEVSEEQSERRLPRSFNPYDLIPNDATMYTYQGSLTTPPCSEVVFWNVIDTPVSISVREFLRLTNLIIEYIDPGQCIEASVAAPSGFTGRPVQPINGREINRICPANFKEDIPEEEEPADETPDPLTGPSAATALSSAAAIAVALAVSMV